MSDVLLTESQARSERITRASGDPSFQLGDGVSVHQFASRGLGALGFSTGIARFAPGASLPYHVHDCGESITVLAGCGKVSVEGRRYHLIPYDSIHIPAGTPHAVQNVETGNLIAHTAFTSPEATRTLTQAEFRLDDRAHLLPQPGNPESLLRFAQASDYELSEKAFFRDLFAGRFGAKGICGGYGRFAPGASLPCHTHEYDESITIVEGSATCLVAGRRYSLSGYDTALVPKGLPHRFINQSDDYMAMLWVYAGDEPERVIVESSYCYPGQPS